MGFGEVDLSRVVHVELGPGSWEELGNVGLHLGFGELLGNKEDLGTGLLGSISIEDSLSSLGSGGVSDSNSVMVEDVVHDIILIGSEVF